MSSEQAAPSRAGGDRDGGLQIQRGLVVRVGDRGWYAVALDLADGGWRISEAASGELKIGADPSAGFDCPGCAWPDDPTGLHLDICENGVKHVTWELAPARADGAFFAEHTVSELAEWNDYDLEAVGRLAEPLTYNAVTDKYDQFRGRTHSRCSVTPCAGWTARTRRPFTRPAG